MITDKQRESRSLGIGASEGLALLGLDPRMSVYDLWLLKTGRVDPPDIGGIDAVKIGTLIESGVLDLVQDRLGKTVQRDPDTMVKGHFRAHPDGLVDGTPIEAKAGWHGGSAEWGEDGDSKVPDRVLVQLHVQMICCDADTGWAARLYGQPHGGIGFSMHPLTLDTDLARELIERSAWFWSLVETDTPPPLNMAGRTETCERYLAQRDIESGGSVELPDELITDYLGHKTKADEHAEAASKLRQEILLRMGDAKRGTVHGVPVCTQYTQARPTFQKKALLADHPELSDLIDSYTRPGTPHSVLRITAKKE